MDNTVQRPSKWAFLLLLVAAAASIATSEEPGLNAAETLWTSGEVDDTARIEVVIQPAGDRMTIGHLESPIFLEMRLTDVPEALAADMRWRLAAAADSADIASEGRFVLSDAFDYGPSEEDGTGGGTFVDAYVRLGQLCPKADPDGLDCLPCELEAGCTLLVDVDACLGDQSARLQFAFKDNFGSPGYHHCDGFSDDESAQTDQSPCKTLVDWVSLTQSSGDQDACGAGPVDDEEDSAPGDSEAESSSGDSDAESEGGDGD